MENRPSLVFQQHCGRDMASRKGGDPRLTNPSDSVQRLGAAGLTENPVAAFQGEFWPLVARLPVPRTGLRAPPVVSTSRHAASTLSRPSRRHAAPASAHRRRDPSHPPSQVLPCSDPRSRFPKNRVVANQCSPHTELREPLPLSADSAAAPNVLAPTPPLLTAAHSGAVALWGSAARVSGSRHRSSRRVHRRPSA